MKKRLLALLSIAVATILILSACGNQASQTPVNSETNEGPAENANTDQVYKITVGHSGGEDTMMHRGMEVFKEEAEKLSNGRLSVEVFPNGQLGGDRAQQEAVQMGDLTMTASSTAPLAAFQPKLSIFSLPYVFPTKDIAYEVLDGPFGQKMLDMMEESGFKALGFYETHSFRQITTTKTDVHSPEDLKGVKIRTMENPYLIKFFEGVGANPTPIAFPEVYTSLQQGIIDGQATTTELALSQRYYEVQKHLITTDHMFSVGMATMNKKFFEELPADLQEVVLEATQKAIDYQRKATAEEESEIYTQLEEHGMQITHLTNEEKAAFADTTKPIQEMAAQEVGQELIDELLEAVENAQR